MDDEVQACADLLDSVKREAKRLSRICPQTR